MSSLPEGRRWALGLILSGLAAGLAAIRFRVAFVTDPLGPRAFPWLAALLLVIAGIGLWHRPGDAGQWPEPSARRRLGVVTISLLVWSLLLPIVGFVPSTTLEIAFLGRSFGARTGPGLIAGLGVSIALWALFGYGLGLPLPVGIWG